MNAHDLIKEAIAEKGKFDSVYWIACGGSMIDLIPAHELLQREARCSITTPTSVATWALLSTRKDRYHGF